MEVCRLPDVLVYLAAIIYFSSFTILPVVLILVGIIRRRKANGVVFFMTGSFLASVAISGFLPFPEKTPLAAVFVVVALWMSYRLFLILNKH